MYSLGSAQPERVVGADVVQITIDIEAAAAERIAVVVGGTDAGAANSAFSKWAVEELAAWLAGQRRFRTLSEQYISWVEALYDGVLPRGQAPTFDRLYNDFNMTHGQATYVARALSDKRLTGWRTEALATLNRQLEAKRADAERFVHNREPNRTITLRTSRLGGVELLRLGSEAFVRNNVFAPPESKGNSGDVRTFAIEAQTVIEIIRSLTPVARP
jgi:hypothetical protein